jgi:hypothetical protein
MRKIPIEKVTLMGGVPKKGTSYFLTCDMEDNAIKPTIHITNSHADESLDFCFEIPCRRFRGTLDVSELLSSIRKNEEEDPISAFAEHLVWKQLISITIEFNKKGIANVRLTLSDTQRKTTIVAKGLICTFSTADDWKEHFKLV